MSRYTAVVLLTTVFTCALQLAESAISGPCSVDAAFTWNRDRKLYFLKGENYMRWEDGYVGQLKEWKFPSNIDAALSSDTNTNINYVFKGCLVWTVYHSSSVTLGPFRITQIFRGIPCNLDAASTIMGKIFFFKGKKYWVWDDRLSVALEGNTTVWPNIETGIDSAFQWDGNTYFLKGRTYWRFDNSANSTAMGDASIGWSQLINGPLLTDCACDCTNCCGQKWDFREIVYQTERSKFTSMGVRTLDQQVIDNRNTAIAPTVGYIVKTNVTESELFINSKSETLEVGRKFICNLPYLHDGKAYASRSIPTEHQWAMEISRTELKSVKYVSPTVPFKMATLTTTLEMVQVDVPFVMTMTYKQRGCECTIDGSLKMQRLKRIKFTSKVEEK